jgi:transposase
MDFTRAAWERAMKVQEVFLQAMSGAISWLQAAEIIGVTPRSMRRWRNRYEFYGYDGLLDRRRRKPSSRAAPFQEVQRILRLYRERYGGFNGRHFHQIACREHGVTLSYSYVKKALQAAGLLPKKRARGRHRRRREPRACFGEMLLIDGSRHRWLSLDPERFFVLITVLDDATKHLLYAQFFDTESSHAVMTALRDVILKHGLPMVLYTDRATWAVATPPAGHEAMQRRPTQLGRALKTLGIEHILSYSPQARGRTERANRTLQDRLVNEMRVAGIRTSAKANAYLRERFLPDYNATFGVAPRDPISAFVPLGRTDLDTILCYEEERKVGRDNTVVLEGVRFQIAKQRGRRSCVGLTVLIRRHLDGTQAIWLGPRCLGRYDRLGRAVTVANQTHSAPAA